MVGLITKNHKDHLRKAALPKGNHRYDLTMASTRPYFILNEYTMAGNHTFPYSLMMAVNTHVHYSHRGQLLKRQYLISLKLGCVFASSDSCVIYEIF